MNQTINNIKQTISQMVVDTENGNESPFESLANLKDLDNLLKDAIKYIMEIAISDASKYEKTFNLGDHQFSYINGRKTFNFKNIKEWSEKKSELKKLEDKYKANWSSYQNGITGISNDGEVLEIPEVTFGKDILQVKINHNLISK